MTAAPDGALAAVKAELRRAALVRRPALATAAPDAGHRLATALLRAFRPAEGAAVAGYFPMRDEIDPRPAMALLALRGHPLCLPVVVERGRALAFRGWRDGDPLERGPFGTSQPRWDAPPLIPAVLLVPLLAFDDSGHRLGYGGGFYDRTLAALRPERPATFAIGLAYAGQRVDAVPHGPGDATLDAIATEAGFRRRGAA